MPLQLCEECGWMHWHNDPCRSPKRSTAARKDVRQRTEAMTEDAPHLSASKLNSAPTLTRTTAIAGTQALPVDTTPPNPKRSGNRHRPGYFTEYMRDYRKGIRRRKTDD